MNTTETTPTPITIIKGVSFLSLQEGSNYVKVELPRGLTAHFHAHGEMTRIVISGEGCGDLSTYRLPTVKAMSVVAYAIAYPDSFLSGCRAFLTQE